MRKTYVKREKFDSNLDIVNLKNGLYNMRTGKLEPHSPDYYSLNQKPFPYNPKARPKYFIKFLKDVLYAEDILTAIDIIAYTFLRYNPQELLFYFDWCRCKWKECIYRTINQFTWIKECK